MPTSAATVVEFPTNENVEGNRFASEDELIFVPAGVKYDSLIEVPTSFPTAFDKMIEDRL